MNNEIQRLVEKVEGAGVTFRLDEKGVRLRYPTKRIRQELAPLLDRLRSQRNKVEALLRERAGKPPDESCHTCYGRQWWQRPASNGGGWVCATCHPNPQSMLKVETAALGVLAPRECPALPKGVLLKRYQPKTPPVAVDVCTVVTDVGKFIRVCIDELDARLHHPIQIRAGASVFEILAKLAEVGVEVAVEAHPPSRE